MALMTSSATSSWLILATVFPAGKKGLSSGKKKGKKKDADHSRRHGILCSAFIDARPNLVLIGAGLRSGAAPGSLSLRFRGGVFCFFWFFLGGSPFRYGEKIKVVLSVYRVAADDSADDSADAAPAPTEPTAPAAVARAVGADAEDDDAPMWADHLRDDDSSVSARGGGVEPTALSAGAQPAFIGAGRARGLGRGRGRGGPRGAGQ